MLLDPVCQNFVKNVIFLFIRNIVYGTLSSHPKRCLWVWIQGNGSLLKWVRRQLLLLPFSHRLHQCNFEIEIFFFVGQILIMKWNFKNTFMELCILSVSSWVSFVVFPGICSFHLHFSICLLLLNSCVLLDLEKATIL